MKKASIFFVYTIIISMLFSSCSKEESPSTSTSIEGKWSFNKTSFTQSGITSPEFDYTGNQAGCSKDYIEIMAGGVVNSTDYTAACVLASSTGTWSRTGSNLTVSVPSISLTGIFEIVTLTTTELKLSIITTQNGVPITINQTFTKG